MEKSECKVVSKIFSPPPQLLSLTCSVRANDGRTKRRKRTNSKRSIGFSAVAVVVGSRTLVAFWSTSLVLPTSPKRTTVLLLPESFIIEAVESSAKRGRDGGSGSRKRNCAFTDRAYRPLCSFANDTLIIFGKSVGCKRPSVEAQGETKTELTEQVTEKNGNGAIRCNRNESAGEY